MRALPSTQCLLGASYGAVLMARYSLADTKVSRGSCRMIGPRFHTALHNTAHCIFSRKVTAKMQRHIGPSPPLYCSPHLCIYSVYMVFKCITINLSQPTQVPDPSIAHLPAHPPHITRRPKRTRNHSRRRTYTLLPCSHVSRTAVSLFIHSNPPSPSAPTSVRRRSSTTQSAHVPAMIAPALGSPAA